MREILPWSDRVHRLRKVLFRSQGPGPGGKLAREQEGDPAAATANWLFPPRGPEGCAENGLDATHSRIRTGGEDEPVEEGDGMKGFKEVSQQRLTSATEQLGHAWILRKAVDDMHAMVQSTHMT